MRRFLPNLLLTLGATLAALLFLEGLVRVLDIPPRPLEALPINHYRLASEPVLRYEYRPYPTPIRRIHAGMTANSQGFLDYEYSIEKRPGDRRLVILGDSTTVGRRVENFADTYPKRLEEFLNGGNRAPTADGAADPDREDATKIEVLSLAVAGYQTLQEAETLRLKGLRYDPDLVIMTFCVNDYDLSSDGGIYTKLWQQRYLSQSTVEEIPWLQRRLRASRLFFVVGHRLRAPLNEQDQRYVERFLGSRSTVRAGLEVLSELQQDHGFPVLVLLLPEFSRPFGNYRSLAIHQRVMDDAAGLAGLQVVDLLPYFAASGRPASELALDGVHMNAEGHRIMADILGEMVRVTEDGRLSFEVGDPLASGRSVVSPASADGPSTEPFDALQ